MGMEQNHKMMETYQYDKICIEIQPWEYFKELTYRLKITKPYLNSQVYHIVNKTFEPFIEDFYTIQEAPCDFVWAFTSELNGIETKLSAK